MQAGVAFYILSAAAKQKLIAMVEAVYQSWRKKIGMDSFKKLQTTLGN